MNFLKKRRAVLYVLLFIIFMAAYVVYTFRPKTVGIPVDKLTFINWQVADSGYVSNGDPQIILPGTGYTGKIATVVMECDIDGEIDPQIFYKDTLEVNFSEEKSFRKDYLYKDGKLTLTVDESAANLRIDLYDGDNLFLSNIRRMTITYAVAIDMLNLVFMAFFIAIILGGLSFARRGALQAVKVRIAIFGKYADLLINLVRKDISIKYRRSILGILWSVLNPLMMMIVITSVFRNLFKVSIENFPMYYLTGSLLFNFMSEATSSSMGCILGAGGLIRKVYIPKYIFPLEKCLFALINALFSFAAVLIMIPVLHAPIHWTMLLFLVPMLFVLVFSIGVGFILSALTVFFRDINHLYSVWIIAWMYLTPIIYPVEILPKSMAAFMELNPMYHYVDYFRQLAIYGHIPGARETMICAVFSVSFFVLGLLVFKRTQDRFILYI